MFCKGKKTPEKQYFYTLYEVNAFINCCVIAKRNTVKIRPVHFLEDPALVKLCLYILIVRGMSKHQMGTVCKLFSSSDLRCSS